MTTYDFLTEYGKEQLEKAKNNPLYEYYDPMTGNYLIPTDNDEFIVIPIDNNKQI